MANPPSPPWTLRCPDCDWHAIVFARGAHGKDPGSGVEAAQALDRHRKERHPRPAPDYDPHVDHPERYKDGPI